MCVGRAGRRPTRADRQRADELLIRVGLGDRLAPSPEPALRWPAAAGGHCPALIHRPPLILADEPTGNLDADGARAITELLVSMARDEGATVVIVTHDERVAAVADLVFHPTMAGLRGRSKRSPPSARGRGKKSSAACFGLCPPPPSAPAHLRHRPRRCSGGRPRQRRPHGACQRAMNWPVRSPASP